MQRTTDTGDQRQASPLYNTNNGMENLAVNILLRSNLIKFSQHHSHISLYEGWENLNPVNPFSTMPKLINCYAEETGDTVHGLIKVL